MTAHVARGGLTPLADAGHQQPPSTAPKKPGFSRSRSSGWRVGAVPLAQYRHNTASPLSSRRRNPRRYRRRPHRVVRPSDGRDTVADLCAGTATAPGGRSRQYVSRADRQPWKLPSGPCRSSMDLQGRAHRVPRFDRHAGDLIEVTCATTEHRTTDVTLHWHGDEVASCGETAHGSLTQDVGHQARVRLPVPRADQVGTYWYHHPPRRSTGRQRGACCTGLWS